MDSSRSHHDDTSNGYKPSPYPISILPKVHHAKPRPSLVQTVDVPPTPLNNHGHGRKNDDDVDSENGEHDDSKTAMLSSQEAKGPTPISNSRRGRRRIQSASITTKSKMIEVIEQSQTNLTPTYQSPNSLPITKTKIICATCQKNEARYSCPKCQSPYCSVSCYKIHDSNGSKVCTETFYKHRVLDNLRSNDDDGSNNNGDLRGILARMHGDIHQNMDRVEHREETLERMLSTTSDHDGGVASASGIRTEAETNNRRRDNAARCATSRIIDGDAPPPMMSDDDLAELAAYVLGMGDDDDDSNNDVLDGEERGRRLLESIPPHLLFEFERALASEEQGTLDESKSASFLGDASGMSLENQMEVTKNSTANTSASNGTDFLPSLWWIPDKEGGFDEAKGNTTISSASPTLDDRIVALPPLPTKIRNGTLSYNILEVLYASSFVMRVKRGAGDNDDTVDVPALLLSQSRVLADDARYGSVREALLSCAERVVEIRKTVPTLLSFTSSEEDGALAWDTIGLDVAIISYHRRYVLRMLFEALDACESSRDEIKRQLKTIKSKKSAGGSSKRNADMTKRELEENKLRYKLAAKKIQYFLSWTSSMWSAEVGRETSEEVRAFVSDWQPLDAHAGESSVEHLIRGIHANDGDDDDDANDGCGLLANGLLNLGSGDTRLPFDMGDQMVSILTTCKK